MKDPNVVTDSLMENTYKEIIDLSMPTHTGMNADELLSLPSHEFRLLVKLCKSKEDRQRKQIDGLNLPKF